jgi:hypothetical protein
MSRYLLDVGIKVALAVCLTSACTACATKAPPEPVIRTVEVKVPVPVACVPKALGDPTIYVDTDAALKSAAGPEDRFQLLAAGRIQRNQRLAQVEPVIKGCRQ